MTQEPQPAKASTSADESTRNQSGDGAAVRKSPGKKAAWTKAMIFLRRLHLYAGLFLVPWVFLYGITGAMYNHQWLLPEAKFTSFPPELLESESIKDFPAADQLAEQVIESIQSQADGVEIARDKSYAPEFTNKVMYEVFADGERYVVEINPVDHSSTLIHHPQTNIKPEKMLEKIRSVDLQPNPLDSIADSVPAVLTAGGIDGGSIPKPHGWSKLNFIASIDGEPARITYVLKDGHVEISRYNGQSGMSLRRFFMRLHTTHGQGPHWNGRMFWTIILDTMAIAMVCWGMTGLLMWWQIKRTRRIGLVVLALSVATAIFLYLSVQGFYATTLL
ncbi:MAG: hypothetical protein Aurels2KO_01680 [Aureliella sp.]